MADLPARASELERIEAIKIHAIIAMFSDDELMEKLVLKGGNALDLIYRISPRGSKDLDFSMEEDFPDDQLPALREKFGALLEKEYRPRGYLVFDVVLDKAPEQVSPEVAEFWGGYRLEFKLIELEKVGQAPYNLERMRRQAAVTGPGQKRRFMIEISKHEYCRAKDRRDLEGYTIYVYSPELIVCEKLRAICQQMPEYARVVPNPSRSPRARDFFDIVIIMEKRGMDLASPAVHDLISRVFAAKRVPPAFIAGIPEYREYHRPDFSSVLNALNPGEEVKDFDYYFDYVVEKCRALEPLWKK